MSKPDYAGLVADSFLESHTLHVTSLRTRMDKSATILAGGLYEKSDVIIYLFFPGLTARDALTRKVIVL